MSREEEYLRRLKALGYEPSLAGMDDEDIEWELERMDRGRQEAPSPPPVRTVYRPVDPGLAARIFRQMGRPYDASAIPKGQAFYLNGWDNGEDDGEGGGGAGGPAFKLPDIAAPGKGEGTQFAWGPDPWAKAWRPDWGPGGNPLRAMEDRPRSGMMRPSRGDAIRPLSYTMGGNDVNTGGQGTNTAAANRHAGWYAEGGAYENMTLPEGAQQPVGEGAGMKPSDKLVGFLTDYEKLEKESYLPTPSDSLTIGFGHKIKPGEDFSKGISEDEAWKLFKQDIQEHADAINQWAADNNLKLTQQQFDALVSLRFNMGSLEGAPKLRSLIISGNATPAQIRKEFMDIIKDKEGPQPGLWRRRNDEANMFSRAIIAERTQYRPRISFRIFRNRGCSNLSPQDAGGSFLFIREELCGKICIYRRMGVKEECL